MPKQPPDEDITAQQAADIAGVNRRTIRRWVNSNKIIGRQLPGGSNMTYLVSKQSLLKYLQTKGDQAAT